MRTDFHVFGWAFLGLGMVLVVWTLFLYARLRRDPASVIRPMWHGIMGEREGRFVGCAVIAMSITGAIIAFVMAARAFGRSS